MGSEIVRVVAAVVSDGDRMLVCRRPAHKRHGGLWEFPGGKCEAGESDAEAVARELLEELGVLVVEVGEAEFVALNAGSEFVIVFLPVVIQGAPVCHEHSELAWGTVAELVAFQLAPSDRKYVAHLVFEVTGREQKK